MDFIQVAIFSTTKNKERYNAILKTWATEFEHVKVFTSTSSIHNDPSTIALDIEDNFKYTTLKRFKSIEYLFKHHPAKWYLSSDDDAYFYHHHLNDFLKSFNSSSPYLIYGQESDMKNVFKENYHHTVKGFKSIDGGAGIIFSHALLQKIIPFFDTFLTQWYSTIQEQLTKPSFYASDLAFAYVAQTHANPTLISNLSFHRFPPHYYPIINRDHGVIKKSEKPISFHYLKASHMYVLHKNNKKNKYNLRLGLKLTLFYYCYFFIHKICFQLNIQLHEWRQKKR